jgi:hypothetical protein
VENPVHAGANGVVVDVGYGKTDNLTASLEEVSRLLNAYSSAILASGSDF